MEESAWSKVKIEWEDCTIGFCCVCGEDELLSVDSQNDPTVCDKCGRVYTISVKFTVDRGETE